MGVILFFLVIVFGVIGLGIYAYKTKPDSELEKNTHTQKQPLEQPTIDTVDFTKNPYENEQSFKSVRAMLAVLQDKAEQHAFYYREDNITKRMVSFEYDGKTITKRLTYSPNEKGHWSIDYQYWQDKLISAEVRYFERIKVGKFDTVYSQLFLFDENGKVIASQDTNKDNVVAIAPYQNCQICFDEAKKLLAVSSQNIENGVAKIDTNTARQIDPNINPETALDFAKKIWEDKSLRLVELQDVPELMTADIINNTLTAKFDEQNKPKGLNVITRQKHSLGVLVKFQTYSFDNGHLFLVESSEIVQKDDGSYADDTRQNSQWFIDESGQIYQNQSSKFVLTAKDDTKLKQWQSETANYLKYAQ